MATVPITADWQLDDHGSVVILTPLNANAAEWLAENVDVEPWQHWSGGIACEPRCVEEILTAYFNDYDDCCYCGANFETVPHDPDCPELTNANAD